MGLYENETDFSSDHYERLLKVFEKINIRNVWSKVKNSEEFTVKRFKNGFINDVCACVLTDETRNRLSPTRHDSEGVVVKFFSKSDSLSMDSVKRAAIYSTISTAGLCPKLIYIDDDCCVNEFLIDAREPQREDDSDEELCEKLFRDLANFHHLNVPVSFPPNHWNDSLILFRNTFPGAQDVLNGKLFELLENDSEFSSYKPVFQRIKFGNMFEYFLKAAPQIGSPTVFCHMDFHRANRLITNKIMPDCRRLKRFYLLDFDTVMFSYRGFDLGAFFYTFQQEEYGKVQIAPDCDMLKLIEVYRQECSRICGEEYLHEESNSAENILREAKFFMIYYFFMCNFFRTTMYCQDSQKTANREFLQSVYDRQVAVEDLINKYKDEGILPNVEIDI